MTGTVVQWDDVSWAASPDGFTANFSFYMRIESVSRPKYIAELYRRPHPHRPCRASGAPRAYGRARHRGMKKQRRVSAWAAARTIHKDWGDQ